MGYSLWGLKESDPTERLTLLLSIHCELLKKNFKVFASRIITFGLPVIIFDFSCEG